MAATAAWKLEVEWVNSAVADAVRAPIGRRAVITGVAGAACVACSPALPAAASLKTDIAEGEAALAAAGTTDSINDALEKLLGVVEDFGGIPSQELSEQIVNSMRSKRSAVQGNSAVWNGITEESYNRLMRSVDPWRVTELRQPLQNAILSFPLA